MGFVLEREMEMGFVWEREMEMVFRVLDRET